MALPERLASVLSDPPRAFSPAPIWWWSGEPLDPARPRWQLERFVEGGVYQLVVLNLAPAGTDHGCDADDPPFFSERWWQIFLGGCDDATELEVSLWFYDQLGFSGADIQARLVARQPAYAGRRLERLTVTGAGRLVLRCPAGGRAIAALLEPLDGGAAQSVTVTESAECEALMESRLSLFYETDHGFDYLSAMLVRRCWTRCMVSSSDGSAIGSAGLSSGRSRTSCRRCRTGLPTSPHALSRAMGTTSATGSVRCGIPPYRMLPRYAGTTTHCGPPWRRRRSFGHCTRGTRSMGWSWDVIIYGRTKIWTLGVNSPQAKLVLPADGNLAIYNTRGEAVWNRHMIIGTLMPGPQILPVDAAWRDVTMYSLNHVYTLQMRTDGNLVLLQNGKTVLWSTGKTQYPLSSAWIDSAGRFSTVNRDATRPGRSTLAVRAPSYSSGTTATCC